VKEYLMPIHDWTRVDAGIFHHFHHDWISEISRALNRALAGTDYYALAEQIAGGRGPDVLTLQQPSQKRMKKSAKPPARRSTGGVALATTPPRVRFRIKDVPAWYAGKKKAVTIRHVSEHQVVSVLEIVSPGNKASRSGITAFTLKAQDLLAAGIHLALVDLFPPTPRDPEGIHPIVWGEDDSDTFRFDARKPLTCASYIGGTGAEAFVEPVGVGDVLPELPLFLTPLEYVPVSLEATYLAAFDAVPAFWRDSLGTS
jgi:hypothetical protein